MAEDFLERLIRLENEARYQKTYTARVIDNAIGDGKLKLSCEELGWEDEFSFAEAAPHDSIGSRILPEIGDYIEIGFHAGKEEFPWWGKILAEINQKIPEQYTKETDRILYEDRKTGDFVKYDAASKKYQISITGDIEAAGALIALNGDAKGIARLDDTTLSNATADPIFWTWLSAAGAVLAGLGVAAPIPTALTSKINSASSTVKTD